MDSNRYAPPLAAIDATDEPATPTFMDAAPKPVAALLLQILCAAGVVWALYLLATMLGQVAGAARIVRWWPLLLGVLVCGLLLAWFGFTLVGIQRRTNYGRRLGLTVLAILLLSVVVSLVPLLIAGDRPGVATAYRVGQFFGCALWLFLIGAWINKFALSKKARAWFRMDDGQA